jgi:hypothetical protein
MPRKKAVAVADPEVTEPESQDEQEAAGEEAEDVMAMIDAIEPGLLHAGRYGLYKDPEGGFVISYQPDGEEPRTVVLPGALLRMAKLMSKGPLGALARAQARRMGEDGS